MAVDLNPLRSFVIYVLVLMAFQIGWVVKGIPFINKVIVKGFDKMSGLCLPLDLYWDSLFSWEMLETVWRTIQIDLNKTITLKEKAPDAPVVYIDENNNNNNNNNDDDDGKMAHLLDHATKGRLLVMNFGSLTCPVFTARLNDFFSIEKEFEDIADFVIVYIEEAHPSDGWAFKSDIKIKTHHSIKDRCEAARLLQRTFNPSCPVLVDSMLDAACMSYGATPIRLHAIKNGILEYEGGTGPFMYNMENLRNWLVQYKNTT